MKQKIFTASLLLFSFISYCQTEATTKDGKKVLLYKDGTWMYDDCTELIKTETHKGKTVTSAKETIKILNVKDKTGVDISFIKATNSVVLNFATLNSEIKCVNKNAPMVIVFTDGSKTILNHMNNLNCKGDFTCYLGATLGNTKELEALATKKIAKITIEYTKTKDTKISKYDTELVFSNEQAERMMKSIQCLSNL